MPRVATEWRELGRRGGRRVRREGWV